jgi:lipopolysaccharide/colanic/teichoic acid biosynthesis glycosyltransferase
MNLDGVSYTTQIRLKRALDIIISAAGLLLLAPIMAIIALAIHIDSPGKVIFCHRRVGKDGRPFKLYKFRSMASGGDDTGYMRYLSELIESERNGSSQGLPYRKMDGDPRVTRVGRFLRNYYLDELPQLFNILIGDMSLVGPRPHVQFEVDNYTLIQRRRLTVQPGATGLWQVFGKGDCTFSELVLLDLAYIDHWSLSLDLKIISMTGKLMLRGGESCWARKAKRVPGKAPAAQPESHPQTQEEALVAAGLDEFQPDSLSIQL